MTNNRKGKSNNKNQAKNNSGNNTITGLSQTATCSSMAMASNTAEMALPTHNNFDALYTLDVDPDAPCLPKIPAIPGLEKLNETQRKKMLP